ncbi:hypothetical protein SLL00_16475 [Metabacillus indicus]|nr:hypothetical protein [Metabacillus indicus]
MALVVICRSCSGSGKVKIHSVLPLSRTCRSCSGSGRLQEFTYKS